MATDLCPPWVAYLLASPLRKLVQNPYKVLSPYVKSNMQILEIGCAMGFFTLPLAELTGNNGKVFAVDIQKQMIDSLNKKIKKNNINNVELRVCNKNSFCIDDLKTKIDFSLIFAVAHEVPSQERLFNEVANTMKTGGLLLFAEPKGHVNKEKFTDSINLAIKAGFKSYDNSDYSKSLSIVLQKI